MNKKLLIPGIVFAVISVVCAAIALYIYTDDGKVKGGPDIENNSSVSVSEDEPYVSPVDFDALKKTSEDVHAWLTIPKTDISYPVAQSQTNDAFYLKRALDGSYSINGTLFTEHLYNSTDFEDPVTAIYGHDMKSGAMFGLLQECYSDKASFQEHREIIVYCPDKELHYEVFAAVPYSKRHILHYYNSFKEKETVDEFLDEVYNVRAFGANFASDIEVGSEDKLLILSTCLKGDISRRYLVIARLKSEIK
ncbi:MAG: class B sortase [Oscillospiraceae bacterium]|nr:class B sortase [Oscillospiraceae bacterium]